MGCIVVVCVSVCMYVNVCRVSVQDACFGSGFGLKGLWVAGYSFCEDVHADQHCDPKDARLAVRLCTTDGALFVMRSEDGDVQRFSEQKGGFIERRLCMARGFGKKGLSSGPGALLSHSCARKDSYQC
mmetsp:Transcript_20452/g.32709  ORF Transcript_20452/g.32709 Transcript_20452/m.32709 type:complete len:128 (+) Transcript_20452:539-922(+)